MSKAATQTMMPVPLRTSSRLWLEVQDIMSRQVVTVSPEHALMEAARCLKTGGVSSAVVVDGDQVVGLINEADLLGSWASAVPTGNDGRVKDVMASPVISVSPHRSICDTSRLMEQENIERLPVLAKDRLVGIVSRTDVIRALTYVESLDDVGSIMSREVETVGPRVSVLTAARIMVEKQISCLVVGDRGCPLGLFGQQQMVVEVMAQGKDPTHVSVQSVMVTPVQTVTSDCSLFSAARLLDEGQSQRLIVMQDSTIAGIVTRTDLFHATHRRLQTEEQKGFALLQESDRCIYMLDSEGNTLYVNPAMLRLFGVTDPEVFLNQPFLPDSFWADARQREFFARALETGDVAIEELALRSAQGQPLYVSVTAQFTRDIHGRINGSQGCVHDITPRKLAEQASTVAYEHLEQANRELKEMQAQIIQNEKLASIGQLAAGVAHEMNTPVGFVTSNLKTLEKYVGQMQTYLQGYERFVQAVDRSQSPALQTAWEELVSLQRSTKIDFVLEDLPGLFLESSEGLERITDIVQGLRDFSRVDQAENFDEYQINAGVEATLLVARSEIGETIEVGEDCAEIPPVPCNAGQINQVLLSLIVNAAQALHSQADRFTPCRIDIRTFATKTEVCCEISDNGPGIPPESLEHIFEPFFTTKPEGQGTGLGLSVAYDIVVNKHQGQLLVDSKVGQGATFIIRLPLYPPER